MELKTPDEWLQMDEFKDTTILDPDGWDRSNFTESWNEKITLVQFRTRLYQSTVMCKRVVVKE